MAINGMLREHFNESWYLETYPDVALSGQGAWSHYNDFGRYEGRWPGPMPALILEQRLWQGNESVIPELQALTEKNDPEAEVARWVLARWYAFNGDWSAVVRYIGPLEQFSLLLHLMPTPAPYLCLFEAYIQLSHSACAEQLINSPNWPANSQLYQHNRALAQSMLQSGEAKLTPLNSIYRSSGLAELAFNPGESLFDALTAHAPPAKKWWQRQPLVTVIFPCYNCSKTLPTAVHSVLNQSWRKLQIIVVDDASTDNTWQVMQSLAAIDSRIECVQLTTNEGAYGARNAGLERSKGQFITTHDADDWSHPQKIERQVKALITNKSLMATRSAWVRTDEQLNFTHWRPETSWIYPNVSSLMFRRSAFKRLGYWDAVSADGDTEFYYRLQTVFGGSAIKDVNPDVPLAFGRMSKGALTQASATHLKTQLGGARADYQRAAEQWHRSVTYLSRYPQRRPFIAPLQLCRGTAQAQQQNEIDVISNSCYFNADYYLERYPDVAKAGMDAARHYTLFGGAEGRDPSCLFSSSAYSFIRKLDDGKNPLSAFLTEEPGAEPLKLLKSDLQGLNGTTQKPLLLVVAHSTVGDAFGAEKSLLDVLTMLRDDYRLWLLLPSAHNTAYVDSVTALADAVSFMPLRWWQADRKLDQPLVDVLATWLQQHNVQAVYVNTLTQLEPQKAARMAGVPVLCHVRELPQADPELCHVLGADADTIKTAVLSLNDWLVANSQAVAEYFQQPERVAVVPNVVDVHHFDNQTIREPSVEPLTVGMLSSNVVKKGVEDFFQVASELYTTGHYDFVLYGPETELVEQLSQRFGSCVTLKGYVEDPATVLRELDVVLNLSHFQESFGRSVVEAMAARRTVIAYNWGALPELLDDHCGILVRYKDKQAVIDALQQLRQQPQRLKEIGLSAWTRAQQFAPAKVKNKLVAAVNKARETQ